MSKVDEAIGITYEVKGYIDYVVCGLKGIEFNITKINKLQQHIISQQQALEDKDKLIDKQNFEISKSSVENIILQSKLDKIKAIVDNIDYRGNKNNDISKIKQVLKED